MIRILLLPGEVVCDAVGLAPGSEARQILRMFLNTMVWGAVAVAVALRLAE